MQLKNIQYGVVAGLAGGAVFGIMMGMMGMLPMIGAMAGMPNAFGGFAVHMMISAFIGVVFALLLGSLITGTASGLGYGVAYGAAWWLMGPLTLMPLMMGMGVGVNWNAAAAVGMLPSLMGHMIYGLILGGAYAWLARGEHRDPTPSGASAHRA